MPDERVGSGQDGIRAAVVLIERNDFSAGEIRFKVKDILIASATPGIDRLVRVAYGKNILVFGNEGFGNCVLG